MSCADSVCRCADIKYDYSLVVPEINALQHKVDALVLQIEWFRDGLEADNELRKIVTAEKAVAEEVKYHGEMMQVKEEDEVEVAGLDGGKALGGEGVKGEDVTEGEEDVKNAESDDSIGNKLKRLLQEMKALKVKGPKGKEDATTATESKGEQSEHAVVATNENQVKAKPDSEATTLSTQSSYEAESKATDTVPAKLPTVLTDASSSAVTTNDKQPTPIKRYNSTPLSAHASFHRLNPLTTYSVPLSTTDKAAALASIGRMSKLIGLSKLHKALLRESLDLRVKVDPRDKQTLKLLDGVGEGLGVVREGLVAEGVVFPS